MRYGSDNKYDDQYWQNECQYPKGLPRTSEEYLLIA